MRKKELLTCKEDLDNIIDSFIGSSLIQVRGDEKNAAFQIVKEINSSHISPSHEIGTDRTENAKENYIRQNEGEGCAALDTFTNN